MAEHLFQVKGFKDFQNGKGMRQSPVLFHDSLSGSLTSKIEVANSDGLTSVYLCLRSSRDKSICTDIANAKVFMDQEFAETKFQVGRSNSQLFYGHRVIIAPACPVLKQMMSSSKDHVVIDDVAMTVFLTIMRYIYCHEIMIDKGFVYETLAAADKFEMPNITFAVAALIDSSILPIVCNYTKASESKRFGSLCAQMIRENVKAFLTPERFMLLTQASVAMIVADDELACDEILLWDICMDWARQECENRLGKVATAKDMRLAMKPFLSDFRFRFMSLEEYTRGPADSGILKLVEVVDVYSFFASSTPLTFSTNEKRGPIIIWFFLNPHSCYACVAIMDNNRPFIP